jgi:hypothetical protein
MHDMKETVSENEVRDLAYHLFEENGRFDGRDIDDWLEAERLLRSESYAVEPDADDDLWHGMPFEGSEY